MNKQAVAQKVYEITLLISRLALMNLMWIAFTIMGLGVFGLVPATVAIVGVFRSYEREGDAFRWSARAWQLYKAAFRRFWLVSFLFVAVCASLTLSLWVLKYQNGPWLVPLVALVYVVALALPYLAANEANFELTIPALVKNSLLLPAMWTLTSIKILAVEAITVVLCALLPGLIPVMCASVPLFVVSALITVRWNKQLRLLGKDELPIADEQRPAGASGQSSAANQSGDGRASMTAVATPTI